MAAIIFNVLPLIPYLSVFILFSFLWVGRQGFGPAARAADAALSRLARCAGKRSRVYSAPRPDGFEPVARQQKSGRRPPVAFLFYGGPSGVRTLDLGIKSEIPFALGLWQ